MNGTLKKGDFVMHRTEGWYGVVVSFRGEEPPGKEIYKIMILDPKPYYRLEELEKKSPDEVPFHIMQQVGRD
jgi:hypothetical protein